MTDLIRWGSPYKLGHKEIDQQHEQLIRLLNTLHAQWQGQAAPTLLRRTLRELAGSALEHFRTEEQLMVSNGYARYASHKAEHDAFAAEVTGFQRKFEAGNAALDEPLFDHLALWLRNHLIVSDRPMGRVIFRKPAVGARLAKAAKRIR